METSPLQAPTPSAWVDEAVRRWPELLSDHANCEKKAASTALAMMFAYPEDRELASRLSRLAREELRHFEQVDRLMQEQGVPYLRVKSGRYASRLRAAIRSHEPWRKLDLLLCGVLIEARSCERFRLLAARPADGAALPAPVAELYAALEASEARHFQLYLRLAERHAQAAGIDDPRSAVAGRLKELAVGEAEAATDPDPEFRFHSGAPASGEGDRAAREA
ncbi:MAG: tRNA-(ms[2]io[6]A)-hydroxylase [Gammaproteobacteria bacterium]